MGSRAARPAWDRWGGGAPADAHRPACQVEFDVRWPEGSQQWVHSPSTVVEGPFTTGARYGFPCSRAAATPAPVEVTAARLAAGEVQVAGFRR